MNIAEVERLVNKSRSVANVGSLEVRRDMLPDTVFISICSIASHSAAQLQVRMGL